MHGLVDRMLIATPLAYRPTLSEMETAVDQLSTEVVENFQEYFANINDTVEHLHFTFAEDAKLLLRETIDDSCCGDQHSHPTGTSSTEMQNAGAHSSSRHSPPCL